MFTMQLKQHLRSKIVAAAFGAGLALTAGAATAETVLSYSPWLPTGYVLNDAVLRPWMAQIEEVTEGRVRVEWRGAAVGSPAQQHDVVRDGLVDMALMLPGYQPGRFPLMEMGELPLLSDDVEVLAPTFARMHEKYFADLNPFPGTHVLGVFGTTPAHVTTSKGFINELSDFEGLKLRAPNATIADVMKKLGAIPIQKPVSQMYELASTGIVDGTFFTPRSLLSFNVADHFQYVTLVPGGLGQSVMALLINQGKWNSISDEDQKAITAISGVHIGRAAGKAFAQSEEAARVPLQEKGVRIQPMAPEVVSELGERIREVEEAWFVRAEKAGLQNPAGVLADFRAELKAAEVDN